MWSTLFTIFTYCGILSCTLTNYVLPQNIDLKASCNLVKVPLCQLSPPRSQLMYILPYKLLTEREREREREREGEREREREREREGGRERGREGGREGGRGGGREGGREGERERERELGHESPIQLPPVLVIEMGCVNL